MLSSSSVYRQSSSGRLMDIQLGPSGIPSLLEVDSYLVFSCCQLWDMGLLQILCFGPGAALLVRVANFLFRVSGHYLGLFFHFNLFLSVKHLNSLSHVIPLLVGWAYLLDSSSYCGNQWVWARHVSPHSQTVLTSLLWLVLAGPFVIIRRYIFGLTHLPQPWSGLTFFSFWIGSMLAPGFFLTFSVHILLLF